jgi:hypothetical protein
MNRRKFFKSLTGALAAVAGVSLAKFLPPEKTRLANTWQGDDVFHGPYSYQFTYGSSISPKAISAQTEMNQLNNAKLDGLNIAYDLGGKDKTVMAIYRLGRDGYYRSVL